MEITINILELASELAHRDLLLNYRDSIGRIYEDEHETQYTDEAQDIFNYLYDDYIGFIEQFNFKP